MLEFDDALDRMLTEQLGDGSVSIGGEDDALRAVVARAHTQTRRRRATYGLTALTFVIAIVIAIAAFSSATPRTQNIQVQPREKDALFSIFNREPTAADVLPDAPMYPIDNAVGSRLAYESGTVKVWVYKVRAGCGGTGPQPTGPCEPNKHGWHDAAYCIELLRLTDGKVVGGGGACPAGDLLGSTPGVYEQHQPKLPPVAYALAPDSVLSVRYGDRRIPVENNVYVIDDVDTSLPLLVETTHGDVVSEFPQPEPRSCIPVGSPWLKGTVGCVLRRDRYKDHALVYDHEGGKVVGTMAGQFAPQVLVDRVGVDAIEACTQALNANQDPEVRDTVPNPPPLSAACKDILRELGVPQEQLAGR